MKKAILFLVFVIATGASFAQPSFVKDSLDSYIRAGYERLEYSGTCNCYCKRGKAL